MDELDPYASWSLSDRLQMLAFEAELAHLPRSLIIRLAQLAAEAAVSSSLFVLVKSVRIEIPMP